MSSHNAKADFAFHNPSTEAAGETSDAEGRPLPTAIDASLTIDEDFNLGCDPYNATGQHVVVKLKESKTD